MLTLALSKGRIYDEAVALLARIGIEPTVDPGKSRKLILPTNRDGLQFLIIRATDVPTYVEYGAADLGIAGKDVLAEYETTGLYEPLDLGIARCRLMTAGKPGMQIPSGSRLRVATKYVKTAHEYFASCGIQADIIKLYGSMELAPLVGLADCIVDVVDTGNTLRANGLEPQELIMEVSSRLILNKAAMKMKHEAVIGFIDELKQALAQTEG
jgi:ATP phosphoribosyltransferase